MEIQLQVVLADYAVTHDGKVMMAGAGWSQVGSGIFTSALALMAKIPWDMTEKRIRIHAELVDEDGRNVLVNASPWPSTSISRSPDRHIFDRVPTSIRTWRFRFHPSRWRPGVVTNGASRSMVAGIASGTARSSCASRDATIHRS